MKILFICNQNENRSKTAEELFKNKKDVQVKSAGLYNEKPVTKAQIQWADLVIVMEDAQRKEISNRFPKEYLEKRIVSLDIPDIYSFGDKELVDLLKKNISSLFKITTPKILQA